MQALLVKLNDKPYKNTVYKRQYFFEQYVRALLKGIGQEKLYTKDGIDGYCSAQLPHTIIRESFVLQRALHLCG